MQRFRVTGFHKNITHCSDKICGQDIVLMMDLQCRVHKLYQKFKYLTLFNATLTYNLK